MLKTKKRIEIYIPHKYEQKRDGVAKLVSDKVDLKVSIARDRQGISH